MSNEHWATRFYQLSDELKEAAVSSVKKVLYERAMKFAEELKEKTPRDTGGLRDSIKVKEVLPTKRKPGRIGYEVVFDGYDEHGRPYQLIANSLNFGYTMNNGKIVKTSSYHFVTDRYHLLKGIDPEIDAVWREELGRISKNGD